MSKKDGVILFLTEAKKYSKDKQQRREEQEIYI
jgi:hypothetical protein